MVLFFFIRIADAGVHHADVFPVAGDIASFFQQFSTCGVENRLTRIDRAMIAEAEDGLLDLRPEPQEVRRQGVTVEKGSSAFLQVLAFFSPDGKRLAFSALDRLWIMDLPNGKPRRLTTSTDGEHSPTWSPDGKYIAYVSWNEDGGDIWRVAPDGGKPEKLTTQSAYYDDLMYAPNGTRLVAARAPRTQRAIVNDEINPKLVLTDLVWIPATGGAATYITSLTNANRPAFTRDSSRIWIYEGNDGLVSLRWDGTDRRAHLKVTGFAAPGGGPNAQPRQAQDLIPSPDGTRARWARSRSGSSRRWRCGPRRAGRRSPDGWRT